MKNNILKICTVFAFLGFTFTACNSDRRTPDTSDTSHLGTTDNNQLEDTMNTGTNQTDTVPPVAKSPSH